MLLQLLPDLSVGLRLGTGCILLNAIKARGTRARARGRQVLVRPHRREKGAQQGQPLEATSGRAPTSRISAGLMPPTTKTRTAEQSASLTERGATAPAGFRGTSGCGSKPRRGGVGADTRRWRGGAWVDGSGPQGL